MPLIGVLFYFSRAPRYIPEPIIKAKLFALVLLTIVLPILLFFLLKTMQKIKSADLESTKERVLPLGIYCIILLIVATRILPYNELIELYYFFIGILYSTITCLILVLLKYKSSIHMIAVGGVIMFFIAFSIHFNINIIGSIALISIITGAIATSRLHLKAHTVLELIIGFFIGVFPQLILLNYWL